MNIHYIKPMAFDVVRRFLFSMGSPLFKKLCVSNSNGVVFFDRT